MVLFAGIELQPGTTFCVVGLGRFGSAVSDKLMEKQFDVIMIDINKDKLDNLPARINDKFREIQAVDSTNEQELRRADIKSVDVAIVAIGGDVQANILTAINLKDLGIPRVIAKAQNKLHGRLLERIGIDQVIYPEYDAAADLVRKLTTNNLLSSFDLNENAAIVAIKATDKIAGRNLRELRIRELFACNVVALQKDKDVVLITDGTEVIGLDQYLIIVGNNESLDRFEQFLMSED
jgi:trk system potassium uptake protein TrkA